MVTIDADLTGMFLIAMPSIADERFRQAVVYICAHDQEGALGLIVNQPVDNIQLGAVMEYMGIHPIPGAGLETMQRGGPVDPGRGFVLHSPEAAARDGTMQVSDTIWMTASRDILVDVAQGHGPRKAFYALGYSGWGAGQLEEEIVQNGWLVAKGSNDLIFAADSSTKWMDAMHLMGVDPLHLSTAGGRA